MKENKFDFKLDGEMEQILSQIKKVCPVTKVNLNKDDAFHIVGAYMVASENMDEYNFDLDDLNDDTILITDTRNVVEKIGIIDGALAILKLNGYLENEYSHIFPTVIKNITSYCTYGDFKNRMDEIVESLDIKLELAKNNVRVILHNIWFLPYGEYDLLAERIMKEVKEDMNNGNTSEHN